MPRRPPKRYGFVRELLRPTRHGYIPPPRAALAAAEVYSKAFWGSAPSGRGVSQSVFGFQKCFSYIAEVYSKRFKSVFYYIA